MVAFRGRSAEHVDKRTLQLTLILVILSFFAAMFPASDAGDPLSSFATMLTFSLLIVGLYVLRMRGWKELRIGKTLIRIAPWSIAICIVIITVFLFIEPSTFVDEIDADYNSYGPVATLVAGVLIGLILGAMLLLVVVINVILCYGVVGIISGITKRIYPNILGKLRRIDTSTTLSMGDRLMLWIFAIPDVLDPGSLTTRDPFGHSVDMKSGLKTAVIWQIGVGSLILLYVSLNPLLDVDITWVVGLISSLSVLIPIIVLPMFPLRSISAELDAPVRPFSLFEGFGARLGGLISLVGTIVIFLRLTLQDVDLVQLLQRFSSFYIFFVIFSIVSSFVYFLSFDQEISGHIHRAYTAEKMEQEP